MGRVDGMVSRLRAAMDRWLPWYDEVAAERTHRTVLLVVDEAEKVIGVDRTEVMRGSFRKAGKRLGHQ